jgi:hypothetical protein
MPALQHRQDQGQIMQLNCICCTYGPTLKAYHALVSAAGTATTLKILVCCTRHQGVLLLLLLLLCCMQVG